MHTAAPGRHCMQVRRDPATVPSAGPAPFHRLVAGGKAIAGGPRVWYGVKASSQARDAPGPLSPAALGTSRSYLPRCRNRRT
jgi:hypothetical protein